MGKKNQLFRLINIIISAVSLPPFRGIELLSLINLKLGLIDDCTMNLRTYLLNKCDHFVAMEYFGLVLNRTYLVLVTDRFLIGLKVNGLVSVEGGGDPVTILITGSLAIRNDLNNPYSYIRHKYLKKLESLDINSDEILKVSSSSFRISRKDIVDVYYDKRKKWGMGHYPHDGKVHLKTKDNKKREFIIYWCSIWKGYRGHDKK